MNANTEKFVNFPDILCQFNEAKSSIFVFCEFLQDLKFLENRNNIFESSSVKTFLRQSFRVVDFSNMASHSRYLQSVTLKYTSYLQSKEEYSLVIQSLVMSIDLHRNGKTSLHTNLIKMFNHYNIPYNFNHDNLGDTKIMHFVDHMQKK